LHTSNRYHPFQGEVNHFPFYPWLPGAVRDRVLAWIMKHRRDLVNYTDYPAVNWFSYPQLSRVLREMNLEVYDRLDLMDPAQMTGLRAALRWMAPAHGRRARGKFFFYLASPTVSLDAARVARLFIRFLLENRGRLLPPAASPPSVTYAGRSAVDT